MPKRSARAVKSSSASGAGRISFIPKSPERNHFFGKLMMDGAADFCWLIQMHSAQSAGYGLGRRCVTRKQLDGWRELAP